MKLSIVTAVRNAVDTIDETLQSLAAQRYRNFEHIVVDGVSTDGTLQRLNQWRDSIHVLRSEPDNGIYDAFNKGLRLTSGDVVAYLNADDIYASPDALEIVVDAFANGDADIVFGDVTLVRAENPHELVRYYRSNRFNRDRLARGFMPAHPSMFVRRSIYERFGEFDASYRIAGDFAWVARVLSNKDVRYSYVPAVLVRMRHGGASTQGLSATLKITRELRRACKECGIETSYLKLASRFPEKLLEYIRRPS